eukprot:360216-Lingulodinium_polyedra.AAC.1
MRRASWSAVKVRPDGTPGATLAGPVWASLPQTPQAAEHCAFAAAAQVAVGRCRVHADCKG